MREEQFGELSHDEEPGIAPELEELFSDLSLTEEVIPHHTDEGDINFGEEVSEDESGTMPEPVAVRFQEEIQRES